MNENRRVLILDDNESIHGDFRKILTAPRNDPSLTDDEAALFGEPVAEGARFDFELDFGFQGQEGLEMVIRAVNENRPYAMAFVDVRMPPGWDGVETIPRLWQVDPNLQIVICSAHSDYSWDQITESLGVTDKLLILKKPFDAVEARQLAVAMTEKWNLGQRARLKISEVERLVEEKSSELASANNQLRQSAQVLEQRVADRTRELEEVNDDLTRSRDAAEAANRAKSEFLAVMSHELRTPLNGVIGMLELLLGSPLDEQQRKFASLAKLSGDALLTLINDILDFSKIEAGRIEIESAPFDLHDAVGNVSRIFTLRAQDKGLSFQCAIHPHVPARVVGDSARLQQILTNLIGNSVKFTRTGHIDIRVVPDAATADAVVVRFVVSDSGIGIPDDRLSRLFKPFSQADSSTTREYGGTGLGLAICRRLVEAMGGAIGVYSTVGAGSTFWFTLPLRLDSDSRPRPALQTDIRGLHVLVVGDSPVNRDAIGRQLQSAGIHVEDTEDGSAAIARLREAAKSESPYGMVVLDMQMSGRNDDIAQRIKSDPLLQYTILVLLGSVDLSVAGGRESPDFAARLNGSVSFENLIGTVAEAHATARRTIGAESTRTATVDALPAPASFEPGTRILVAEDDLICREVISSLLARAELQFDIVENGSEALEAVRNGGYQLVLMDGHMPGMDGFTATAEIRKFEQESGREGLHVPIIALTANALKGDRERCLAAGMDDYLTKPIDAALLMRTIARYSKAASEPTPQLNKPASPIDQTQSPIAASPAGQAPALDLDLDALVKRWGREQSLTASLVRKFCARTPADVDELDRLVRAADAAKIKDLAHRLKGAASYTGAESFRRIVATLESEAAAGQLDSACDHVNEIRAALARYADQARIAGFLESPSTSEEMNSADIDCRR